MQLLALLQAGPQALNEWSTCSTFPIYGCTDTLMWGEGAQGGGQDQTRRHL